MIFGALLVVKYAESIKEIWEKPGRVEYIESKKPEADRGKEVWQVRNLHYFAEVSSRTLHRYELLVFADPHYLGFMAFRAFVKNSYA